MEERSSTPLWSVSQTADGNLANRQIVLTAIGPFMKKGINPGAEDYHTVYIDEANMANRMVCLVGLHAAKFVLFGGS